MSPRLELTTPRLTLIPVTLELIDAETGDRAHLSPRSRSDSRHDAAPVCP